MATTAVAIPADGRSPVAGVLPAHPAAGEVDAGKGKRRRAVNLPGVWLPLEVDVDDDDIDDNDHDVTDGDAVEGSTFSLTLSPSPSLQSLAEVGAPVDPVVDATGGVSAPLPLRASGLPIVPSYIAIALASLTASLASNAAPRSVPHPLVPPQRASVAGAQPGARHHLAPPPHPPIQHAHVNPVLWPSLLPGGDDVARDKPAAPDLGTLLARAAPRRAVHDGANRRRGVSGTSTVFTPAASRDASASDASALSVVVSEGKEAATPPLQDDAAVWLVPFAAALTGSKRRRSQRHTHDGAGGSGTDDGGAEGFDEEERLGLGSDDEDHDGDGGGEHALGRVVTRQPRSHDAAAALARKRAVKQRSRMQAREQEEQRVRQARWLQQYVAAMGTYRETSGRGTVPTLLTQAAAPVIRFVLGNYRNELPGMQLHAVCSELRGMLHRCVLDVRPEVEMEPCLARAAQASITTGLQGAATPAAPAGLSDSAQGAAAVVISHDRMTCNHVAAHGVFRNVAGGMSLLPNAASAGIPLSSPAVPVFPWHLQFSGAHKAADGAATAAAAATAALHQSLTAPNAPSAPWTAALSSAADPVRAASEAAGRRGVALAGSANATGSTSATPEARRAALSDLAPTFGTVLSGYHLNKHLLPLDAHATKLWLADRTTSHNLRASAVRNGMDGGRRWRWGEVKVHNAWQPPFPTCATLASACRLLTWRPYAPTWRPCRRASQGGALRWQRPPRWCLRPPPMRMRRRHRTSVRRWGRSWRMCCS